MTALTIKREMIKPRHYAVVDTPYEVKYVPRTDWGVYTRNPETDALDLISGYWESVTAAFLEAQRYALGERQV